MPRTTTSAIVADMPQVPSPSPLAQIYELDIEQVIPNPDQPRKTFTHDELQEMASSIDQDGVLMPIKTVMIDKSTIPYLTSRFEELMKEYPQDGFFMIAHTRLARWAENEDADTPPLYLIVYGERRWRGSRISGKKTIPSIVDLATDDKKVATQALIENMQRQQVGFIEEAKAIRNWMVMQGMNPVDAKDRKAAGARLGKSGTFMNWRLDSLQLRPEIQKLADDGSLSPNEVTHLAWCDNDEQQLKLFQLIARGQCKTHVQLEAALKALKAGEDVNLKKNKSSQQELPLQVQDKSKAVAVVKKIESMAAELVKMNAADAESDFEEGIKQMSVGELQHIANVLAGMDKMIRSIHKNKVVYQEQAILASTLDAQKARDGDPF